MKKIIKWSLLISGIISLFASFQLAQGAAVIPELWEIFAAPPNPVNYVRLRPATSHIGSSTDRIDKGWFDDVDTTLLTLGGAITGDVHLNDDANASFGNTFAAPDVTLDWETADADAHYFNIAVSSVSRNIIISEDRNVDWALATSANPQLVIQSADATEPTQRIRLSFNVDGIIATDAGDVRLAPSTGLVNVLDDVYYSVGTDDDARWGWNTTQTVDALYLGLPDGQNNFIIAENGDRTFDFARGASTNPTLCLFSAVATTTQSFCFTHNQTNALITTGTGDLFVQPAGNDLSIRDATNARGIDIRTTAAGTQSITTTAGVLSLTAIASNIQANPGSGLFTNVFGDAAVANVFQALHGDNTSVNSHARFHAVSGGASGGDPYIQFEVTGAGVWSVGIDNSNSDILAFANSSALGTSTELLLDTGNLYPAANGGLSLGTALSSFDDLFLLATGVVNWGNGNFIINNNAAGRLTFTPTTTTYGANDATITLDPTYSTEAFTHQALAISATQNGAATNLEGLVITLTKATAATTLDSSNILRLAAPSVTGSTTVHDAFQIDDQANVNIGTARAFKIIGTGAANAIVLGNSPLLYSDAANSVRIMDTTDVGGLDINVGAGGDATISNVDTSEAQIVFQNQTISRVTAGAAVAITPIFAAADLSYSVLSLTGTQNGANSSELNGLSVSLTKATGATTIARMQSISVGAPGITGSSTIVRGISINNQGETDAGSSYGIDFENQSGSGLNRAMRIQGTGATNAIEIGDSPLIYSSGAEVLRFDDSTAARGILFTLTAAGAQTIAASAGNLQINAATGADTVFNSGQVDVDFSVHGDNQTNLIWMDASNDSVGIGTGASSADTALFVGFATRIVTATNSGAAVSISTALTEAGSDTHPRMIGVDIGALTLTGGVAATTAAASVRIEGAPTGGDVNYSLWVDAGATQLDGTLTVVGDITASADLRATGANSIFGVGAQTELTITAGSITANRSNHTVDTQADAATDDLDEIVATAFQEGDVLVVSAENGTRTVVAKHGTGNLNLNGQADRTLDNALDKLMLILEGTVWTEVSFSNNGA